MERASWKGRGEGKGWEHVVGEGRRAVDGGMKTVGYGEEMRAGEEGRG